MVFPDACGNPDGSVFQVAQKQFADWSHLTDALERMFEYNLISFPPTLQKPVWFHPLGLSGERRDLRAWEEARIANQQ
jgi:hypothetical protein